MILSATALQRKLASLSEHNFREYARMIVESYEHRGLLIDALLWGAILGHYEAELARAKGGAELSELEDFEDFDGTAESAARRVARLRRRQEDLEVALITAEGDRDEARERLEKHLQTADTKALPVFGGYEDLDRPAKCSFCGDTSLTYHDVVYRADNPRTCICAACISRSNTEFAIERPCVRLVRRTA